MAGRWRGVAAGLGLVLSLGCSSPTLATLDSGEPERRRDAVLALSERAVDPRDPFREERLLFAEKLRRLSQDDPSPAVRIGAIDGLARLALDGVQGREALQALGQQAREGRDPLLRIAAVERTADVAVRAPGDEALRRELKDGGADVLKRALRLDEDRDVRIAAARELGRLKPSSACSDLINALRDETPDVRFHARRALRGITGKDLGAGADDWQRWLEREGGG